MVKDRINNGAGASGPLEIGEGRTVEMGKGSGRFTTIIRTEREYIYDLCDAYNAVLTRDDLEWSVVDREKGKDLILRERGDFARAHSRAIAQSAERDQKRWADQHKLSERPFAPAEAAIEF